MNLDKIYEESFNRHFRADEAQSLKNYLEKKRGWIYVATSKNNNFLKIGRTGKSPLERASTLSTTGVLHHYQIAFSLPVFNQFLLERAVHKRLKSYRVEKEFFNTTLTHAIKAIEQEVDRETQMLSRFIDVDMIKDDIELVSYALKF